MKIEPIFVVGVPRSGTTLLAAMLGAHSRLGCGPETHFFRFLADIDVHSLLDSDRWPSCAVNFVSSITLPDFVKNSRKRMIEKYEAKSEEISRYLSRSEPAVSNILSSVTEPYMKRMGKIRWVEKTPTHIEHLSLIRKYFPNSPIIRIIRDPRDVALSLTKVPWGVGTFLEGLLYCQRLERLYQESILSDDNYYTLRFEDLLSSPSQELQKLCRFIEEEFEERMLDTSETGKLVNTGNVRWKAKASQAIDLTRIAVWRQELRRSENLLAEAIVGDQIEAYGYPVEEKFAQLGEVRPSLQLAAKYADALELLASRGIRFWNTRQDENAKVTVYLGDPSSNNWLGEKRKDRAMKSLRIIGEVIRAAISRKKVYWISDKNCKEWSGYFSFFLKTLLAPCRIVTEA